MKDTIPLLCSADSIETTEEFLREKGKSHLFSCISTDFDQPQRIPEKLKDFRVKIVISGPSHELILRNAGYHVIPLKSIGFNIIDTIIKAKKISDKIVFIWRGKPIINLDNYSEEMQLRIISTCCYSSSDIEVQVREFMANGYNTFIGHRQVCDIVTKLGGRAVCYHTRETYLYALQEAIYQAQMFIQYAVPFQEHASDFSEGERDKTCRYSFSDIIGHSPVMEYTINMAKIFAETNSPILITGETGTGKELLAQGIHVYSSRRNKTFLAINCASISESLFESEFFGYDRGAFTGATREGKAGVFELAEGGTLFLDEIGEIPFSMQIKLLRALQEKQIRRVGGRNDIPVNIRVIAATNQDIEQLITTGQFRRDLYYRLNVLRLNLPSLRDRLEDIPELVYGITQKYHLESDARLIVQEILSRYKNYNWPGNVRELENIVQRLTVLKKCMALNREKEAPLASGIMHGSVIERKPGTSPMETQKPSPAPPELKYYHSFKKQQELDYLNQVIQYFEGNKIKAAEFLHISRTTLWSKLKKAKETVSP